MTHPSIRSQWLIASAILAATAVRCSSAIPGTPLSTPAPSSLTAAWDVAVTGDLDASYSVADSLAYSVYAVSTAVLVRLPSADSAYELVLSLPGDVEPGMYTVPDAFARLPTTVAARFGVLNLPSRHFYESSGGTIEISSSGQYLSGAFEFAARNSFTEGSITVSGTFTSIPWAY